MMMLTCKQCGARFQVTDSEIRFYTEKGWSVPKRCENCRSVRRNRKQSDVFSKDSSDYTFNEVGYKGKSITKKSKIFMIIFVIIIALISIVVNSINSDKSIKSTNNYSYETESSEVTYYLNTYRHKFHRPNCSSVYEMNTENRQAFYGTREEAIAQGYSPCQNCKP